MGLVHPIKRPQPNVFLHLLFTLGIKSLNTLSNNLRTGILLLLPPLLFAYVKNQMCRSISLKTLHRLITSFRLHLTLSPLSTSSTFLATTVRINPLTTITGPGALAQLLHRLREGTDSIPSDTKDEMRAEILACVALLLRCETGVETVVRTETFVYLIAACMDCSSSHSNTNSSSTNSGAAVDLRAGTARVIVLMKAAQVLGPLVLVSEEGLRSPFFPFFSALFSVLMFLFWRV